MQPSALPRPVLVVGVPVVAGLVGVAIWGWMRWGMGVWFDALTGGLSLCN